MNSRGFAWAALCFFALWGTALALEPVYEEGDVWMRQATLKIHMMKLKFENEKGETLQKQVTTLAEETLRRTFRKVQEGQPVSCRVEIPLSTCTTLAEGADEKPEAVPTQRQGLEFVLNKVGNHVPDPELPEGCSLSPYQMAKLIQLEDPVVGLLPDCPAEELQLEEGWPISEAQTKNLVWFRMKGSQVHTNGEGSGKLIDRAENEAGDTILKMEIILELDSEPPAGYKLTSSLSGTLQYNLTRGRPVQLTLNGLLDLEGDIPVEQKVEKLETHSRTEVTVSRVIPLTGQGTLHLHFDYEYPE